MIKTGRHICQGLPGWKLLSAGLCVVSAAILFTGASHPAMAQTETAGAQATGAPWATGYAAAVADMTGKLLGARDPDTPRSPDLIGRIMLLSIALQDVSDGILKLDEALFYTNADSIPAEAAIRGGIRRDRQGDIAAIALARRLALNPTILGERMAALSARVGLQGSSITVGRTSNGAPRFDGQSTARDAVRLMIALDRTYPALVRSIFSDYTVATIPMAIASEDGCAMVVEAVTSNGDTLRIASATHGAPDTESCLTAAHRAAYDQAGRSLTLAYGAQTGH